jgi:hypothetical protein
MGKRKQVKGRRPAGVNLTATPLAGSESPALGQGLIAQSSSDTPPGGHVDAPGSQRGIPMNSGPLPNNTVTGHLQVGATMGTVGLYSPADGVGQPLSTRPVHAIGALGGRLGYERKWAEAAVVDSATAVRCTSPLDVQLTSQPGALCASGIQYISAPGAQWATVPDTQYASALGA